METRYHIGLLTGTLLILAILSYAYYADYNYRKEIARTEQTEQQTSIYEYTNIRVEELPEELQNEIREGKRLEGKDKLYGFLENYSS